MNEEGRTSCAACGHAVAVPRGGGIRFRNPRIRMAETAPEYRSDLTRHLCVAVHLDSRLAQATIEGVFGNRRRVFPATYGVDLAVVAQHAIAGRARHLLRDFLLAALCVLFVIGAALIPVAATLVLVCLWLVVLGELYASHTYVERRLTPQAFGERTPPVALSSQQVRRLEEVEEQVLGNVTVYSGYSPFAGNGDILGSWSFSIDVEKGTELGGPARPFRSEEIRQHVVRAVDDLQWAEIETEERLFVSGRNIRNDRRFLPDPGERPVVRLEPDQLRAFQESPEGSARHYTAFYVSGWHGDLVLAVFLRFVLRPRSLFVEASFSLLPPLQERFYEPDLRMSSGKGSTLSLSGGARLLVKSAVLTPGRVFLCWPRLGQAALGPLLSGVREMSERRAVENGINFDFGAPRSVREMASSGQYRTYFQQLDKDMYLKVLEGRILDAITEFLDTRGVDTHSLRERQTTILNNGVMVSGNASVRAESLAAGPGSAASSVRQYLRRAGEKAA
ncbi:hypothetical protein [Frankia canadensis]|nr:hypothetical protein [Frankia canadensis]